MARSLRFPFSPPSFFLIPSVRFLSLSRVNAVPVQLPPIQNESTRRPTNASTLSFKHTEGPSGSQQSQSKFPQKPDRNFFHLSPDVCSGCGIKLQLQDPNKPGFIYRSADSHNDRVNAWEKKTCHDVYDEIARECDPTLAEKLQNTDQKTRVFDDEQAAKGVSRGKAIAYTRQRPRGEGPLSRKPNHCRRCHEIQYHHNRLPHLNKFLPPPLSLTQLLTDIGGANTDPDNPPLLVVVLDPVDFPLSFFPFTPLANASVLFVVNRADSLCQRESSMTHLRAYFEREIGEKLGEHKMGIRTWSVRCVSAKKGFGIKDLIKDIMTMRAIHSNVYFLGYTNVGKSSVIAAMVAASGTANADDQRSLYRHLAPTASIYPHTTLRNLRLPLDVFMKREGRGRSSASLFDTPGLEGDQGYLQSFIDAEYERGVSLLKVGGFQRPADNMRPGQSLILGGLIRIDLLECDPHPNESQNNHIRITAFTNLPGHITSHSKAALILAEPPSSFYSRKSKIEIVTSRAMDPEMQIALETTIASTGNAARNTVEIVFAGMGFVAVGGNFERAKLRVWTPGARGVGIRRPVVKIIQGGFSLDTVKRPKWGRLILLSGRKSVGAVVPEKSWVSDDAVPAGMSRKAPKMRDESSTEPASPTQDQDGLEPACLIQEENKLDSVSLAQEENKVRIRFHG